MVGGYLYCLYSTEDGIPRYVGRADDKVSYRYNEHVTAALQKKEGALYDWMRDVYRADHDVLPFVLQSGVIPKDRDMFENYWIQQFSGLINIVGNKGRTTHSEVAEQVIRAIKASLRDSQADSPQ